MRGSLRRASRLALGLGLLACASPTFDVADLPDAPIAFVYRTVEESERLLEDAEQARKHPPGEASREVLCDRERGGGGRASCEPSQTLEIQIEDLERYTGRRTADDTLRDQLGRVSFYVAPERRLESADFATRGARPLEWSADHGQLLFAAPSSLAVFQLFEWIAATGEVRQLTRGQPHIDGCYGPAGALAFVRLETGGGARSTARIWVQRPGEAARAVTPGPADGQPAWSPDGTRLVYAAVDPQQGEVLRWLDPVRLEGGVLGHGRSPVFTRDGQWIVFSAHTSAGWKLWRMRPDGSGKRTFGSSAFQESDPAVSPDGRFVVYTGRKSETTLNSRLFVRPLDGSADRHLEVSGSAALPVW